MSLTEADIIYKLSQELLELGYPESSIRREFIVPIGQRRIRIDIAIIDPETSDILAIFEVKRHSEQFLNLAAQQISSYSKLFPTAPSSFIYTAEGERSIIATVNEEDGSFTKIPALPSFSALRAGERAQHKLETKNTTARVSDYFARSCYLLAFLIAAILILDISEIYKFTSQQLTLLGIFIGLLVIPYAAKFKLLGMEFERHKDKK